MRSRVWRFWLISVLMGALPLKGFAFAAMLACCPLGPAPVVHGATAHGAHAAAVATAGFALHTDSAGDAPMAADGEGGYPHAGHDGSGHPTLKTPPCCSAAAMSPPAALALMPSADTGSLTASVELRYRSAPLPGIEHPPKRHSA